MTAESGSSARGNDWFKMSLPPAVTLVAPPEMQPEMKYHVNRPTTMCRKPASPDELWLITSISKK